LRHGLKSAPWITLKDMTIPKSKEGTRLDLDRKVEIFFKKILEK